jgi:hypothetical protein
MQLTLEHTAHATLTAIHMDLFCGSGGFAVGFPALIVTGPEQFTSHDILPFLGAFI